MSHQLRVQVALFLFAYYTFEYVIAELILLDVGVQLFILFYHLSDLGLSFELWRSGAGLLHERSTLIRGPLLL